MMVVAIAVLILFGVLLVSCVAVLFSVVVEFLPDILESWDEAKAALEERKERKRKEGK